MGVSKKTPRWAQLLGPDYFALVASGMSHEDAASSLRSDNGVAIGGMSLDSISRAMRSYASDVRQAVGCSPSETIDNALQEAIKSGERLSRPLTGLVPPPLAPTAFQPLVLPYRDCLVWCDVHIPYHRPEVIEQSIESAISRGIRSLIIAGDFMDVHWGSKFSAWKTKGAHHENIRREFSIAQKIFSIIDEAFEEIIIIPGNHDGGRFMHMTGGSVDFELLCSWLFGWPVDSKPEKVTIGLNRSLVLEGSPRGTWRITHPRKARKIPLSLAEELAAKFQCNVLTAHQHHLGVRMHRHLPYICCDGGHMQDERITDYKQEVDDAHANWVAGWVELVDGWPLVCAAKPVG